MPQTSRKLAVSLTLAAVVAVVGVAAQLVLDTPWRSGFTYRFADQKAVQPSVWSNAQTLASSQR